MEVYNIAQARSVGYSQTGTGGNFLCKYRQITTIQFCITPGTYRDFTEISVLPQEPTEISQKVLYHPSNLRRFHRKFCIIPLPYKDFTNSSVRPPYRTETFCATPVAYRDFPKSSVGPQYPTKISQKVLYHASSTLQRFHRKFCKTRVPYREVPYRDFTNSSVPSAHRRYDVRIAPKAEEEKTPQPQFTGNHTTIPYRTPFCTELEREYERRCRPQ